eukprot:4323254-Prymnesium_polylepis.1
MRARRECHRRKLRSTLFLVPCAGAPTEWLAPRGGPPAPPSARALIPCQGHRGSHRRPDGDAPRCPD